MTSPAKSTGKGSMIWIAGLALVVIVGVIAVIAARGSRNEATEKVAQQQTAPVEVTGAPALPALAETGADAALGQTIPTVTGSDFDGEEVAIGPEDGTAKVIIFAAHWCPHCQRELPILVDHLKDSPMPDDVELLTVSTAVAEERGNYPPSSWFDEIGWTAPVLADSDAGEAATAFALPGFPYFVAVDADGKVVARTSGEIPPEEFDALVEAARTGTAPT
jgi:cytochrome c biogenesis protein CcmG/thiol:disulfide interchange protein DsbE